MVTWCVLLALVCTDLPVRAAALYWTGAVSGTWSPLSNWSTSASVPTPNPLSLTSADTYNFNISSVNANANQTVYLDGDPSADGLLFANTGATTFLGGNAATPAANTFTLGGTGAAVTLSTLSSGPVVFGTGGAAKVNITLAATDNAAPAFTNNSSSALTFWNDITVQGGSGLSLTGGGMGLNTIAGGITTSGSVTKQNSISKWVLSGPNLITGSINMLGGGLRLANAQALGTGSLWIGGGTTEFAGDANRTFNNAIVVSSSNTVVLDRITAGAGVTHTLGPWSTSAVSQSFSAGGLITSGSAGLILGTVTLTGAGTFRALNSWTQPGVRTQVTLGSLTGAFTPVVTGPGDFVISSPLGNLTGLTKNGRGNLTLQGASTGSNTGALTLAGGSFVLDYATAGMPVLTDMLNPATAVTLSGGTLAYVGRPGVAGSQTFGVLTLGAGGGRIFMNRNGATSGSLIFSTLTNTAPGGALLVATDSSAGTVSFATGLTNNLFGGTARVIFYDGSSHRFASMVAGGSALTGTTGTTLTNAPLTSTVNYELSGGLALTLGNGYLNTLRITSTGPAQTLSSTGSLAFTAGGLLFVGADDYAISGSLRSGIATNPDLVIHQYGVGTLTLAGTITQTVSNQSLTKAGPGRLVLTGSNQFSGSIFVNEGILSVAGPGATEAFRERSTYAMSSAVHCGSSIGPS